MIPGSADFFPLSRVESQVLSSSQPKWNQPNATRHDDERNPAAQLLMCFCNNFRTNFPFSFLKSPANSHCKSCVAFKLQPRTLAAAAASAAARGLGAAVLAAILRYWPVNGNRESIQCLLLCFPDNNPALLWRLLLKFAISTETDRGFSSNI